MPRQMSEEKQREFDELKQFFQVWETQLFPNQYFAADHPHHPLNALSSIEQKFGRSRALAGLKQAINDNMEIVGDFRPEQIAHVDKVLQQAGALTLTQMISRQSKAFRAILRRGKIRNDTEFYMVSAALSDTSSGRPEAENATMGSMVVAYEAKA